MWCIERHKSYSGTDDEDILVIQGPSQLFNPTLKQKMIDRAMRDDPEAAEAEWNAQYRSLSARIMRSCTAKQSAATAHTAVAAATDAAH